jgi:hypothetical protein
LWARGCPAPASAGFLGLGLNFSSVNGPFID